MNPSFRKSGGSRNEWFDGSVAWTVCKALDIAHKPFWRDDAHRDYFDGCLRDLTQLRRGYRYVE
jgi:hypothetical protein